MQKIIPHLWFDKEAAEAAAFYTSVFPESKVTHTTLIRDTPSGDCELVYFELWQQEFMAISAGPYFKFNPSVSFIVNFDPLFFGTADDADKAAREHIDLVWGKLTEGGKVLMPIDTYPFSQRYGWVQDKYGLTWQLMLTDPNGEPRPSIVPSLLFTEGKAGKAEEAIQYYLSVFKESQQGSLHRYGKENAPDKEGTLMYADFRLEDAWFAVMDSARQHGYDFNEAVSFMINCADQQEIDHYWEHLSAVPESEQCGWVKDKYGLSWQITWSEMEKIMRGSNQEMVDRLTKTFLKMKKLDVTSLREAIDRKPV